MSKENIDERFVKAFLDSFSKNKIGAEKFKEISHFDFFVNLILQTIYCQDTAFQNNWSSYAKNYQKYCNAISFSTSCTK